MEQMNNNKKGYSLFYALLRNHPEAEKDDLVLTYTGGRTSHLHEMKSWEYREMCNALQNSDTSARTVQLKKARSQALFWIQKLGVDTLDWDAVNAFCLSPKIAGKEFKLLSIAELQVLHKKLRSISDKGGIKNLPAAAEKRPEESAEPSINEAAVKLLVSAHLNSRKNKMSS